jgi:hypothetical protein
LRLPVSSEPVISYATYFFPNILKREQLFAMTV